MPSFATLFDYNYLSRGLCLIDSLEKVLRNNYQLFILALDENTINYFLAHPDPKITIITLQQLEDNNPQLLVAKENRSQIEYYFTLSPILPLYILANFPTCKRITTLDADIYFFNSPEELFKAYDEEAILITPHDFSPKIAHLAQYGTYNVSFQSFPHIPNSLAILADWKNKCLAWCKDYFDPETGYFADQKYLDDWPKNFKNVKSVMEKTCGRAPWNISSTMLSNDGGKFKVDGQPLLYYHFHNLRINGNYITHDLQNYDLSELSAPIKKMYTTYIKKLSFYNAQVGLLNDKNVIRYNANGKKKSFFNFIWENELGAILLPFNSLYFFNVIKLKSIYNRIFKRIYDQTN